MRYRRFIFLISILLLLGPFWVPHVQQIGNHNTFLKSDSVVLIGFALAIGIFCSLTRKDRMIKMVEKIGGFISDRSNFIVLVSLSFLFLALILINRFVLHSFMNSGDEHSCYFLAECIRLGKLWVAPHLLHEFFEVVHIGNRDGKWFSVYPPGWPAIWALAKTVGACDLINPLMGTIATGIFYVIGKRLYGAGPSLLGIVFLATSPFYLFNNASYLSHTTCLLMIALFLFAYLNWLDKKGLLWSILVALALGYGLGTRYLTMAAIGAPVLTFELFELLRKKKAWHASYLWFGIILTGMIGLNLYYNYLISGNPFDAPNHYSHSWERLGFHKDYGPLDALISVLARLFYLIDWFPGIFVIFYLVYLTNKESREQRNWSFNYGFLFLVIAYTFYYSWGGNQYGPRYYFEGLPLLTMSVARRLQLGWQQGDCKGKNFIGAIVLISLLGSFYQIWKHSQYFERVSRERKDLYDLVSATAKKPAVVFVKGFLGDTLVMSGQDAVRNHPGLDTPVLFAHDLGDKNRSLKTYYPERNFYSGSYDRQAKKAILQQLT